MVTPPSLGRRKKPVPHRVHLFVMAQIRDAIAKKSLDEELLPVEMDSKGGLPILRVN